MPSFGVRWLQSVPVANDLNATSRPEDVHADAGGFTHIYTPLTQIDTRIYTRLHTHLHRFTHQFTRIYTPLFSCNRLWFNWLRKKRLPWAPPPPLHATPSNSAPEKIAPKPRTVC